MNCACASEELAFAIAGLISVAIAMAFIAILKLLFGIYIRIRWKISRLYKKVALFLRRCSIRYYAVCMGCGLVHPHFRLVGDETCFTLYCRRCGSRMHERGEKIGFIQGFREMLNPDFCDIHTNFVRLHNRWFR